MKKPLMATLIIGIIVLAALGVWILEKRSHLISGFLSPQYDPLDINQDGSVNQLDLDYFTELYRQDDLRVDLDKNSQVDYNDLIRYTSLYRQR